MNGLKIDDEFHKKLFKDSSLIRDTNDSSSEAIDDIIEETYMANESISYYPSLRVPEEVEEVDGELDVNFTTTRNGYVNKIFLKKMNTKNLQEEYYHININENTGLPQIGDIAIHEYVNEISNEDKIGSFTIKNGKPFQIRENSDVITESLSNSVPINISWLNKEVVNEMVLVRGLLTILKENNIELFEEDFNRYHVSMNWMVNSPLVENLDMKSSTSKSIDKINNSNSKDTLLKEVSTFFEDMVFPRDNDFTIIDIIDYISENIISMNPVVDNETEEDEEGTIALNIIRSLYLGLDHRKISRLSENFHLLALFIYMKYHMGIDDAKLVIMYPISDEDNVVDNIIKNGILNIFYMTDYPEGFALIGFNEDPENGDERDLISIAGDDAEELKDEFKDLEMLALNDISEATADELLNNEISNVSSLITSLLSTSNKDDFVSEDIFNESMEILNEASESSAKMKTFRNKIMTKINKVYNHLDKTGVNGEAMKNYWGSMTDTKFLREIRKFVNDEEKNFNLEVLPGKNEPSLNDIRRALEAIDVPENEYVYFRHLEGTENDPIRTRYEVPVGYLHVRRLQQILSKKNSYGMDISIRDQKSGQVTGDSRTSRISDLEASALKAINADATLKELMGSRADDMGSKNQLYSDISTYGYAKLEDMPDRIEDKRTLNTISSYMYSAGIDNDLTVDDRLIDELTSLGD